MRTISNENDLSQSIENEEKLKPIHIESGKKRPRSAFALTAVNDFIDSIIELANSSQHAQRMKSLNQSSYPKKEKNISFRELSILLFLVITAMQSGYFLNTKSG